MFNELQDLGSFTAVASSRELLREYDICLLEFGAFLNIDLFLEGRRITGASEMAC